MRERMVPALLAAALILSGCGAGAPAGRTAQEAGITTLVEAEARPLTQEEVRSAYDRAVSVYEWFDLRPLPSTAQQKTVDGWRYQKVDYPGIEDMADLRTYLRTVFSQELTDRLLERGDHPLYQDVDGVLYAAADAGREKESGKGDIEVRVVQESDSAYAVEVAVELLDTARGEVIGVESYSFPYEFVEGSWVFTDFQLVY